MIMIGCVSPGSSFSDYSLNTLWYANKLGGGKKPITKYNNGNFTQNVSGSLNSSQLVNAGKGALNSSFDALEKHSRHTDEREPYRKFSDVEKEFSPNNIYNHNLSPKAADLSGKGEKDVEVVRFSSSTKSQAIGLRKAVTAVPKTPLLKGAVEKEDNRKGKLMKSIEIAKKSNMEKMSSDLQSNDSVAEEFFSK